MSVLSKILGVKLLDYKIGDSIILGRGNIKEDYPSDFSEIEKENIAAVRGMTMTSVDRLVGLSRAVDYIVENKIEGDIVECGVWRGGSMLLVAKRLVQLNDLHRRLYLFDTFEGMSAPGGEDVCAIDNTKAADLLSNADKLKGDNVWCYSSLDEVKSNLSSAKYNPGNLVYIKGKVEETLPDPRIDKVALLRLDTDWYESTKHELEVLFDKLVTGGILIIDDYGYWSGSKKAVDEFIKERGIKIFLNRIDFTGRIAVKL